jgi:DNA-binding Lrp family transcriptional regulator
VILPVYFKIVAEATGVSESTIRRILKEREELEEQGISFGRPGSSMTSLSE